MTANGEHAASPPLQHEVPKIPACDWCREKKIRCGREKPQCRNCTSRNIECVYSERAKRDNEMSRTANMFNEVHNRLDRMESMMEQIAAALSIKHESLTPSSPKTHLMLHTESVAKRRRRKAESVSKSSSPELELEDEGSPIASDSAQDQYSTQHTVSSPPIRRPFVRNMEGNTYRYSVGYSDTSLLAISAEAADSRGVSAKTNSPSTISAPSIQPSDVSEIQEKVCNLLNVNEYVQPGKPASEKHDAKQLIPPFAQCKDWIADYFRTMAWIFPIFSHKNFTKYTELMYNHPDAILDVGWIICFLNALMFGVYGDCNNKDRLVQEYAAGTQRMKFMHSASKATWELLEDTTLLLKPTLVNVQALMMMAACANETSRPGLCWILLCSACSLAKSIGLHRSEPQSSCLSEERSTPADLLERRYVFWTLYIMDKSLSLTLGRPSSLPDYDIDVELPEYDPENPLWDLYIAWIYIAKIQSEISVKLYSASALKAPDEDRRRHAVDLNSKLEGWWIRHAGLLRRVNMEDNFERRYLMTELTFSYHNNMILIHRVNMGRGYHQGLHNMTEHEGVTQGSPEESEMLALQHSRKAINLIRAMSQKSELGNSTLMMWLFSYYPFTSFFILFSHIIRNPQIPESLDDFHLLEFVVQFLGSMENVHQGAHKLLSVANSFFRIAAHLFPNFQQNHYQHQEQKHHVSPRKRKLEDNPQISIDDDEGFHRTGTVPPPLSPNIPENMISSAGANIDLNLTSFITCPTKSSPSASLTSPPLFSIAPLHMQKPAETRDDQVLPCSTSMEDLSLNLNLNLPSDTIHFNRLGHAAASTQIDSLNLSLAYDPSSSMPPFDFSVLMASNAGAAADNLNVDLAMDLGGFDGSTGAGTYEGDFLQEKLVELAANEGPLDFDWFQWEKYCEKMGEEVGFGCDPLRRRGGMYI